MFPEGLPDRTNVQLPATRWTAGRFRPIDFLQERQLTTTLISGKVLQTSYDYTRRYWDQIGATIVGRHVFDMTDGWDGKPPGGIDHVVVVTHRPGARGLGPRGAVSLRRRRRGSRGQAQELAGDRMVEVAAGDVGGQVLSAGLIDEVRMDVVPVVFGSGKRYFGSVHAQHLSEDPDVVIQSNRVLHLRYRVRR